MKWEDYQADFEFDGSLRDIYVLNTSIKDWQRFIDFAHSGAYRISYEVDGEETSLPRQVAEIFQARTASNAFCSISAGSISIRCHFFNDWELEFDVDPREIQGEAQAEEVFAFMRQIGQLLSKEVILTAENLRSAVIFKSLPGVGQLQYIPCAA